MCLIHKLTEKYLSFNFNFNFDFNSKFHTFFFFKDTLVVRYSILKEFPTIFLP